MSDRLFMIPFVMATLTIAAAAVATAKPTISGKNIGCVLTSPTAWGGKTMTWSGACKDKRAEGTGVARLLVNGKVIALYYGTSGNGAPKDGIVELIGKDSNGKKSSFELIPESEIHTKDPSGKEDGGVVQFINAYDAIKVHADELEKAGNPASAAYYRNKPTHITLYFGE